MAIMTEITHGTERDTRSSCSSSLGTQKLGESPEDSLRGIAAQEPPLGSEQLHCSKPQAAELQDTAVLRRACGFPACSVLWFGTYLVPKVQSCRDQVKRYFFISSCSLSLEQGHISRLCSETIPDKLNTDLEALGCLTLLLTDSLPSTSKLPSCCNVK